MATYLAKKVGGKVTERLLNDHLASIEPQDPLYVQDISNPKKRIRRELPPGLSARDAKILHKVRKRAHRLDKGVNLCGFRVGWTFFLGLIPFLGDIVNALLNHNLVVKKAKQAELPDWLVAKMVFNNLISTGVGFVPLVGDVVMGVWKANSRNCHLLEEFLALRGQETLSSTGPPAPTNSGRPVHSAGAGGTGGGGEGGGAAPALPPREGGSQKKSWLGGGGGGVGGKKAGNDGTLPGPGGPQR